MRRLILYLALLAASLPGQVFSNLTTDYTGSQLYFTSNFRLKGSGDDNRPKLYRWRNGVFDKVAEAEQLTDLQQSPTVYGVASPQLSSDGQLAAWVLTFDSARALAPSIGEPYLNGQVIPRGDANSGFAISRNGPWIAFATSTHSVPLTLTLRQRITGEQRVVNSQTVAGLPVSWRLATPGAWLTNDGRVLVLWDPDEKTPAAPNLGLISASGLVTPIADRQVDDAWIDPTGRWLAYRVFQQPRSLRVRDLTSGTDREVLLPEISYISSLHFDDLGQTALIDADVNKHSVYALNLASLTLTPYSLEHDQFEDVTLSGDGTRLFALTETASLIRKDLLTGKEEVLAGKTPSGSHVTSSLVPGSLGFAHSSTRGLLGWASESYLQIEPLSNGLVLFTPPASAPLFLQRGEPALQAPPTPTYELGGFSVLVNERPCPIWSVSPIELRFQIPWSLPLTPSPATVRILYRGSPFEQNISRPVEPSAIQFEEIPGGFLLTSDPEPSLTLDFGGPKLFHQDFSSRVSFFNPARPGEILQGFVTGAGRPIASPPEGTLPSTALPVPGVTCGLQQASTIFPTETQAFLSPVYLGIYQLAIKIPETLRSGEYTLGCSSGFSFGGRPVNIAVAPK